MKSAFESSGVLLSSEFFNSRGEQEQHLSRTEMKGLEMLKKRIKKEELLVIKQLKVESLV